MGDTAADVEPDNKDPDKEEDEDTEREDKDGDGNPWDDEDEEEDVDVETSEVEEEPIETSADANTIVIANWYLPYTGLRTVSVTVGDTLTFDWSVEGDTAHNVYLHPSLDCSLDDRSEVGVTSPASYTFTEADGSVEGNTMFFACDIGDGQHCEAGQNLIATVYSSGGSSSTTISTAGDDDDDADNDDDDESESKSKSESKSDDSN